jgi:hypothetical protein
VPFRALQAIDPPIDVAREMAGIDAHVSALNGALQKRPEVFEGVGVAAIASERLQEQLRRRASVRLLGSRLQVNAAFCRQPTLMRFLTVPEATAWCTDRVSLTERGFPTHPSQERHYACAPVSTDTAFCRLLEQTLQPREACLLWVTDWGVWGSENLHLYYRLRQSYGELRLLEDAPAHLFLNYEAPDLISFLQVGLLCGWDMHLIPAVGYARLFVSHDEFVEFVADEANPELAVEFAAKIAGAQLVSDRQSEV